MSRASAAGAERPGPGVARQHRPAHVEAQDDRRRGQVGEQPVERGGVRQRLGADDDAPAPRPSSRSPRAGSLTPASTMSRPRRPERRLLRVPFAPDDRVEVRDVDLREPEALAEPACQRDRVAVVAAETLRTGR